MVPSVPVLAAPLTAKSLRLELQSYPLAPSAGGVNLRLLPSGKGKFFELEDLCFITAAARRSSFICSGDTNPKTHNQTMWYSTSFDM